MDLMSLSTSSLDICKGKIAVIDRHAYPLMWTVLDEIIVKVEETLVEAVDHGMSPSSVNRGASFHQIFYFQECPNGR